MEYEWISAANIVLNLAMALFWAVFAAIAVQAIARQNGAGRHNTKVFAALFVGLGVYRATLAYDYLINERVGFQYTPVALIENVTLLSILIYACYISLKRFAR